MRLFNGDPWRSHILLIKHTTTDKMALQEAYDEKDSRQELENQPSRPEANDDFNAPTTTFTKSEERKLVWKLGKTRLGPPVEWEQGLTMTQISA